MGILKKVFTKKKTLWEIKVNWKKIKSRITRETDEEKKMRILGEELFRTGVPHTEIFSIVQENFGESFGATILLGDRVEKVKMYYAAKAILEKDIETGVKVYFDSSSSKWGRCIYAPESIDVLRESYRKPELGPNIENILWRILEEENKESMGEFYRRDVVEYEFNQYLQLIQEKPLKEHPTVGLCKQELEEFKKFVEWVISEPEKTGHWEPPGLQSDLDKAKIYSEKGYFNEDLVQKLKQIEKELGELRSTLASINKERKRQE